MRSRCFGPSAAFGGWTRGPNRLLALAQEHGMRTANIAMLNTIASVLPDAIGRSLPINVNRRDPRL